MRSGTNRDLLFWAKTRCLACKNRRWGLGPIETSNLCAKVDVFYAQKDSFCLGLLKTCYSVPKVAVLHAKNTHEGWDPWRLVILMLSTLFCMHKTTGESWNQYSLFIPVLSTLLCVLKTTDEVWDPYRLVSLFLKSLFCKHKTTDEGWNQYRLDILVQITPFWLHKKAGEVWDP